MNDFWNKAWNKTKSVGDNILHWRWTKAVASWIIFSAGTCSELAFVAASMWMAENSADHPLMLKIMTEDTTKTVSWFATAAYVGLPVAILPLAILTTLDHAQMWAYDRKKWGPKVWTILYGLPTIIFLALDVITVACSVLSVSFELPNYLIVARALSAYMFGSIALLYTRKGKKQEADRLKEKDLSIAQLQSQLGLLYAEKQEQIRNLTLQIEAQKDELAKVMAAWESERIAKAMLQKEINNTAESALQAYGEECINVLTGNDKTVSIESIMQITGHPRRTITNAIRGRKLITSSRNKELILVSSLAEWLKETPPPSPQLHIVNG